MWTSLVITIIMQGNVSNAGHTLRLIVRRKLCQLIHGSQTTSNSNLILCLANQTTSLYRSFTMLDRAFLLVSGLRTTSHSPRQRGRKTCQEDRTWP